MILSLETATSVCSVALHNEGRLIGSRFNAQEQTASSQLAPMIREVLREAGMQPEKLTGVAVSSGPGSYTGLRIGVATAKGLCFALDIPLMALNTLIVMTQRAIQQDDDKALYCPMIDARRMEVYCLLTDRNLNVREATQARIIDEDTYADHLKNNKIIFFGNGSEKCEPVIKNGNAVFLRNISPHAEDMGGRAYQKFLNAEFENVAEFEPCYLKDFVPKKPKSMA